MHEKIERKKWKEKSWKEKKGGGRGKKREREGFDVNARLLQIFPFLLALIVLTEFPLLNQSFLFSMVLDRWFRNLSPKIKELV